METISTITPRERQLEYQHVEERLTQQLYDYLTDNGLQGGVVGISGGIDSAVVSTLMSRTGLPTTLVSMPIHQAIDQVTRGDRHMERLQQNHPDTVSVITDDLSQVFDQYVERFAQHGYSDVQSDLALVNTRARLRMSNLYAHANAQGSAVIGTGNMVEDYGIGFFTKYGDGGVDYSPIGGLLKSEVYQLGAHMGVIHDILTADPTDGLWEDGVTDEEQIGASYDELERAMKEFIDRCQLCASNHSSGYDPRNIQTIQAHYSDRAREVMDIYLSRHLANRHKMTMPPIATVPHR